MLREKSQRVALRQRTLPELAQSPTPGTADPAIITLLKQTSPMKYIVELYVGGKVFKEEVYANSPKDARQTAEVRNPTAKVVGVNVSFK